MSYGAEGLIFLSGSCQHILLKDVNMQILTAKFVPHLLKDKWKENLFFIQQFSMRSHVKGHLAVIKTVVYRI
jgi:hypothetical protein